MSLAKIERRTIPVFLAILLASIGSAAEWKTTGPPGGTIRVFAVDPKMIGIIYAGTQSGVFRSRDNGATWTPLNEGLTYTSVSSLAIDPFDPRILYAGTEGGGLFKSTDAGRSWAAKNEGLRPEGQRFWSLRVWSVAIDPARPSRAYIGVESVMAQTPEPDFPGGIFKTADGGETWQAVAGFPLTRVSTITIDPRDPSTLYAGTFRCGVLKSRDRGETWTPLPTPQDLDVRALRIDPRETSTIYAASLKSGVFRSQDAGLTWRSMDAGLTDSHVVDIAIDPSRQGTVFALGEAEGVYESDDQGNHWKWMSASLQGLFLGALVVAPGDPEAVLVGSYGRGVFKTVDGGSSWISSSKGMPNASVTAVASAPWAPGRLWATDGRVVFVKDRGGWSIKGVAPPACAGNSLLADPGARRTLYLAGGCGAWKSDNEGQTWVEMRPESNVGIQHLALDSAIDGRIYAGTPLGIYMSVDRGESWYTTNFRDGVRGCLAADPKHAGRVFACSYGRLRRSDDGGRTWTGLRAPDPYPGGALLIDPVSSAILTTGGEGWFRSQDAGSTWHPILERRATQVAIDSVGGIYFAAEPDPGGGPRFFILESTNGGRSWSDLPDLEQGVFSLAVSAGRRILFAATDGGVFELHLTRRAKVRQR